MSIEKVENFAVAADKTREMLAAAELSSTNFDTKKMNFVKVFKNLDNQQRKTLCEDAGQLLIEKYQANQPLDALVYLMTCGFAAERDWDTTLYFLQNTLELTSDAEFFKELSLVWLEICDLELNNKASRLPVAHTSLVLLTEFGLLLANRAGKSAMDNQASGRVVEFITTSLLARSNINSMAMRISLLHFLFKNPVNSNASQQLNRVISRFGQTVLEELMNGMFENKKRETAAFYFLLEHMNLFLNGTPALAEMCHSVLRHYMLKFPDEFPKFLATYSEKVSDNPEKLLPLTKHVALLLRVATDVSQRGLVEGLSGVLIRNLQTIKNSYSSQFANNAELALELIDIDAFTRAPKSILIGDTIQMLKTLLLSDKDSNKVVALNKLKKAKEIQVKTAKLGSEPTPLESLLLLAS